MLPGPQSEPAARHPFRQGFISTPSEPVKPRDDDDIKLFALAFSAFFICFYTFFL